MRNFSLYIYGVIFGGILHWSALNAGAQIPEGWEIVEIFPAGTEYYCGQPDINDRGQIVFDRRRWPSRNDIEIILYDRGKLRQLTADQFYEAFPRINNSGHIVWQRDLDPDPVTESVGIVLWRDGELEVISDEPYYEGSADINDVGHIVWNGLTDPDGGTDSEIFYFDGRTTIRLGDNRFLNDTPRLNTFGDVVFTQYDFRRDPWVSHVLAFSRPVLRQLSEPSDQRQFPDINDHCQVVWQGFATALSLWESGKTTTILQDNAYAARINNSGDICFSRWDPLESNFELWLMRGGQLIQLTNSSLGGGASAINNRGEVAFRIGRHPYFGVALLTKPGFVADLNFDGHVDLADVALFQRCFGLEAALIDERCWSADTNHNEHVDWGDFQTFMTFLRGPD